MGKKSLFIFQCQERIIVHLKMKSLYHIHEKANTHLVFMKATQLKYVSRYSQVL